MRKNDAKTAEAGVAKLLRRLEAEPRLHAELQRARREFFGVDARVGPVVPGAADTAEHRFAEWFTLERDSDTLGAVPVTLPAFAAEVVELADSDAGVYLVQSVTPKGAQALDLQDDALIDLAVPPGSLQAEDLVVGRLFAAGAGQWTPSTASAVFRPGTELAQAFRRDVERLGLERRLQQLELEHLLLRRPDQGRSPTSAAPTVPLEHLEADLEKLLQPAGGEYSVAAISQQLAVAARPGQVIGPLLEQLAFHTEVDLDRARALLLEVWNARHANGEDEGSTDVAAPAAAEPPGETLGERLARTLDEGLRQKRDVGELFAQLERMAGIEPDAEDTDEEVESDSDAAAVRGDLGPLVEEYLWETERANDPAAAPLRTLVELQQNAPVPHSDLESVTAADLMRLLLHVYLGAASGARAASVRTAFAEVRSFYRWAVSTQEMAVGEALDQCHGALLDHLDRLQAAGQALSTATGSTATGSTATGSTATGAVRPGILEIEEVGPRGFGARDDDGGHHWIDMPAATPHVRAGDLVLGALAPAGAEPRAPRRFAGLVVVLPADARALME